MKVTAAERRFALRCTRLAAARAVRSGDVFSNQTHLWAIVVDASHVAKRSRTRLSEGQRGSKGQRKGATR